MIMTEAPELSESIADAILDRLLDNGDAGVLFAEPYPERAERDVNSELKV